MDKATRTNWKATGGGDCRMYVAKVGGTYYRVQRAPFSGWRVETGKPGTCWQHAGYVRTLAEGKAWAEAQREAVTA